MFIYILDDDSLLSIFSLCRPVLIDEDETDNLLILRGGHWTRECWWYKLAHVCRRWRYLILASASYLRLGLVCTRGTPVADMLTHSPPLPLIIDHLHESGDITMEDEEGIMLALQNGDRVRHIRLQLPVTILPKLLTTMNGEFPMLEYLFIWPQAKHDIHMTLPETFRAPHLRHLLLRNFAHPIGSLSIMTGVNLSALSLQEIHPSIYFHPNDMLQRLSLMPQLETLGISFHSPVPNRDVKRKLVDMPITTHVTLPNLRWFEFGGASDYLEAILPQMTTPLLEKLQVHFFNQLTISIPHLLQFIRAAQSLRFSSAGIRFYKDAVDILVYPHDRETSYSLSLRALCIHFDWQIAFAVQVFQRLRAVLSTVEYLTLEFWRYPLSSGTNNKADPTQWRELIGLFSNVKTLRVGRGDNFVWQLSRSLKGDEGESPLQLLPELRELEYPATQGPGNAFSAFINARQNAGRPVYAVLR
jgi:hypothetical protein